MYVGIYFPCKTVYLATFSANSVSVYTAVQTEMSPMFGIVFKTHIPLLSPPLRSVIFRRKRTESDHSLVSEGLREAINSYLQMTEGNEHSWDA